MSMSDRAVLDELTARISILEAQVASLLPKEVQSDLYGPEADHTEDRAARAALGAEKRPGRPARI